jgi:hypothetical protein
MGSLIAAPGRIIRLAILNHKITPRDYRALIFCRGYFVTCISGGTTGRRSPRLITSSMRSITFNF